MQSAEHDDFITDKTEYEKLLQALIQIPSEFENEHKILSFMLDQITNLGFDPIKVNFDPVQLSKSKYSQQPISSIQERFNLVVRVPGRGQGKSIIINSHLDIVPAGNPENWSHSPFGGHIDRDKNIIYGRGAMDDKAGVTIALALLASLTEPTSRPLGDVVFQFVLEDENTGNGTLLCLDAGHHGDAAIILDGTRSDKGINQHAGNCQFKLEMRGKPVAVGVSHMGINAGELLAELIIFLKQTVMQLNQHCKAPWTIFPSPNQFVTQQLHCSSELMTVPEYANAECYVTFTPPQKLEDIRKLLEQSSIKFAQQKGLTQLPTFSWDGIATEPIAATTTQLETIMNGCAKEIAMPPIQFGPSTGISDMRHYSRHGIPCLLYGPGRGYNPHRADEHYHLDDLPKMTHLMKKIIGCWCD
jgi:acetylornithine deacetylase